MQMAWQVPKMISVVTIPYLFNLFFNALSSPCQEEEGHVGHVDTRYFIKISYLFP